MDCAPLEKFINTQVEILAVTFQCSTQILFYSLQPPKAQFLCYASIDFLYFRAECSLKLPSNGHTPPRCLYPLWDDCQVQKEPGHVYVRGSGKRDKEEQWEKGRRYFLAQWTRKSNNGISKIKFYFFFNWSVPV